MGSEVNKRETWTGVVSFADIDAFSKFQNIFPTTYWEGICIKLQIHLLAGRNGLFSRVQTLTKIFQRGGLPKRGINPKHTHNITYIDK